uniref:Uncharacterized protein n=1 Tax=Arundo donax TaxID=35708 RepID=A0A0A9C838_ARUDO
MSISPTSRDARSTTMSTRL